MQKLMIALAIVALCSACSANARIGEPTPAPTAAPQQPQVIVIQQPAPAQQPAQSDGNMAALIVLCAMLIICAGAMAVTMAFAAGRRSVASATPSVPQSLTLTTNNYYPQQSMPPALSEAEQFRILRQQGFTPETACLLIARRNASQIMPPRQ
jgi:hypothetical protein